MRAGAPLATTPPPGRNRQIERRRRVVADQPLRVPVAAVAVDVAGLSEAEQRFIGLEVEALPADPVLVELLGREVALVGHRHRELGAPGNLRGQVDHEAVLSVHAEEEQGAELVGGDRPHRELVGQTQAERGGRKPLHPRREAGGADDAAFDELAGVAEPLLGELQGLERCRDFVVQDVERQRIVVPEVAPPGRSFPGGRVHRDDLVLGPVEQRDVLRLPNRLHVGQRAVPFGADLGEKVAAARWERPDPVADVRQIQGERQRNEFVEHVPGVVEGSPVHPARPQRAGRDPGPERVRVQPDERRFELRLQRVSAAEDLHLPAFRLRLRGEAHDAVAEEHETGDPVLGLGHEHRPLGQRQRQVFTRDDQIVGDVVGRGGETQVAQVVDRVDGVLIENTPSARRVADHVELPRLETAPRPGLGKQLDHDPPAGVLGRVVERGLETRRHGDPVHAGSHVRARERRGGAAVGRR